jgi:acetyl esterase/lipase
MKRLPALLFALLLLPAASRSQTASPGPASHRADPPPTGFARVLTLWPDGAPLASGTDSGDVPKLYYYPAASGAAVHSAVIVLPGGGYTHVVMEKEGAVAAKWLAANGVDAFVLQYRLSPAYRYPAPMLDGQRAVRYVRAHAAEYGIQPGKVGVWGFSAGGHLAGYLATQPEPANPSSVDPVERVSAHPDFAIFAYARLSLDDSIPRPANMEPLVGDHPTAETLATISFDRHVTPATSPSFLYATTGDQTVNSMNATAFYDALKRAGVSAELHIFELGPHGTGMGQGLKGLDELQVWPTLLAHWMQLHGWMSRD